MTTRTYEQFLAVSGPLKDYLLQCPMLDEEDVGEVMRALNPANRERNIPDEDLARMAVRAQELHTEGCFLGDVARTRLDEMTVQDEDILNAVNETALACGHGDVIGDCAACITCGVAYQKRTSGNPGRCTSCDEDNS